MRPAPDVSGVPPPSCRLQICRRWTLRLLVALALFAPCARAAHAAAAPGSPDPLIPPSSYRAALDSVPVYLRPIFHARATMGDGRLLEAEAEIRGLLPTATPRTRADSSFLAEALDVLVETLWRRVQVKSTDTRALADSAIMLKEHLYGRADVRVAVSLQNLGAIFHRNCRYGEAQAIYERAYRIRAAALSPGDPVLSGSLNSLALLARETGDYAQARGYFAKALALREGALGPQHPDVADVLNSLGNVSMDAGDLAAARPLYERALAIREKSLNPGNPDLARSFLNLAQLLTESGDYTQADALLRRALAIDQKTLEAEHPDIAQILLAQANVARRQQDFATASPLYEHALHIQEKQLGPQHRAVAQTLVDWATLRMQQQQDAGARPLLERALAILEKTLGPIHPKVAVCLDNYAQVLARTGDIAQALAVEQRAVEINEKALGADHFATGVSRRTLADIFVASGDSARGFAEAIHTEDIGREHLRLTTRGLSETQALRYAAVRISGLDLAVQLAAARADTARVRLAWDAQIRSRAVVLDEMAARHRSLASNDTTILHLWAVVRAARERLANIVVRGPLGDSPDRYRITLDQARAAREQAEERLARVSAPFALAQARGHLGIREVAHALPAGSALVAYSRYARTGRDDAYAAFVHPAGGGTVQCVPLGAATTVDSLVTRWGREIARGGQGGGLPAQRSAELTAYRAAGEALRRAVWDPVVGRCGTPTQVLLVPDGALHLVSFASLPTGTDEYLVESGPVLHYLSAERDVVPTADSVQATGLLALGGPNFDDVARGTTHSRLPPMRGSCGDYQTLRFAALPGAGREAAEVARLWQLGDASHGSVTTLIAGAATEAAFKIAAPGKRILHLATHGYFLGADCERTHSAAPASALPPLSALDDSPLLLSGLALAGANHHAANARGDDGVLTAEEIAALDLRGTEWAVLSACNTGVGEVRHGEGVFGLRRAFQIAGVHTLVLSLWEVDDQAARQWMRVLYRDRFHDGLGSAAAVRDASRTVLRARRTLGLSPHPFYWAAFVATGDWR